MATYRNLSVIEIRGKPNLVWRNQQGQFAGSMVLTKTQGRSQSQTTPRARIQKTQAQRITDKHNNNLRTIYRGMRAGMNPNLYTMGGFIGGNVGTGGAIANLSVRAIKRVADIAIDIYNASTGESVIANNAQAFIDRLFNPMTVVGDVYGSFLDRMRVNRENRGLAYHRRLTGEIVNTKDKGRY